ncbi:MAG: NADH dehydrogenase (quinone) subunit D [Caldilineaceae bacterium SB0668_bin_21]|nr:NADH dehydrogenase (quinone) subunit D [Caldilineaceae bacterium SB0668_bin_21]MYC23861.1 NADH dehydrogenase (quinone) subunit D [Caldilineaceae bacterium SB0662_bin_25]
MPLDVAPVVRSYETQRTLNPPGIPALAPMPTGETDDTRRICEQFGEDIVAAGLHNGNQVVLVEPGQLKALATFLRDEPDLKYETLIDVTSVDRSRLPLDGEARFQTVYQFRSYSRNQHLTVIADCGTDPGDNGEIPHIDSLTGVYRGAEWPEREVYDLMGIRFDGHPDLRRILMPKNWPNHPLQKQAPLGGEEVPFTFTWDDPEFETLGSQILPAESTVPDLPPGMSRQNMVINMGPHHPSTHGVLRLVVEMDGERIVSIDPDLGFLHSGFEKTGENKRYKDFVYYTDRMDYLSAMSNNLGYCLTIEHMLGLEIPERAQVIRVIMAEMQRIASHLFWLATHVLDVSGTGMSLLMYATRERERILDLFEMACGARLTVSYIRIGGVWQDLPDAFVSELKDFLRVMPQKISEYEAMVTEAPLWQERLTGIGHISGDDALSMGLTGPMLRGSGIDWDLRRDRPYSGYEAYEFEVPTSDSGDCYGRFKIRLEEMRQSVRILEQAVDNLPSGLYKSNNRKVALPPRAELDVSMEALIHHFKLMTEGFHVAPGYFYHGIENSKGELGFFVYSDGSAKPYRLHVHGPSFNNLYAIDHISRGEMLSDVVTNIGSIDIVLGEVDR